MANIITDAMIIKFLIETLKTINITNAKLEMDRFKDDKFKIYEEELEPFKDMSFEVEYVPDSTKIFIKFSNEPAWANLIEKKPFVDL
jgi:hypothetical protein